MEPAVDWPSRELSQRLAEWRLCTPQDLQRCRGAVRRFVRDLPSFDSVWIDILLQHRLLTPYQARVLDSADPDRLRLGSHIIRECVEENAWRGVYRARSLTGDTTSLLTVHALHPEDRVNALESIDQTIARLRGVAVEGLVMPVRAEVGGRELIVESPDIHATPLRELLVRRGRFPSAVTLAIARMLAQSLIVLEDRGVPHGDMRARNVGLDQEGRIHVLHTGLLAAVMPTFRVSQELPIEVCDGVAPEVIASGRSENSISDQYSLGCLLWQLAAGRPPFPTGDAHGKLAAHRARSIPDVRDLAPQSPKILASAIKRLTQRTPAHRYSSFRELALQLGAVTSADRKLLKRFFHAFETEAPTQTARETSERSKQLPSTLAAVVIGGATLWLFVSDPTSLSGRPRKVAQEQPKSLPAETRANPIGEVAGTSTVVQTGGVRQATTAIQPLPAADASGVISLTAGATYLARNVSQAGPLSIRAADGGIARVIVRDPWELASDSIRLENVQLECYAPLRLQCRGLDVSRSVVVADVGSPAEIEWRPQDAAAASPGMITITDSHFLAAGLKCASRPSMIRVTNCLKSGPKALVQLPATGRAHQTLQFHVMHTTLRESGPLVEWTPGPRAAGQRIEVATKACVFAPASGSPLLALAGSLAPAEWDRSIAVVGLESLLQSGSKVVDLVPPPGKPRGTIEAQKLEVDGLMTAAVEFFGSDASDVASSGLKSTDSLFSVDDPPGIHAAKLAKRMVSQ
jgi:hypothetical protein